MNAYRHAGTLSGWRRCDAFGNLGSSTRRRLGSNGKEGSRLPKTLGDRLIYEWLRTRPLAYCAYFLVECASSCKSSLTRPTPHSIYTPLKLVLNSAKTDLICEFLFTEYDEDRCSSNGKKTLYQSLLSAVRDSVKSARGTTAIASINSVIRVRTIL